MNHVYITKKEAIFSDSLLIKEGGDPSLRTRRTYNKKKRLSFQIAS